MRRYIQTTNLVWILLASWFVGSGHAATCRVESSFSGTVFKIHVSADCTEMEREAKAIEASRVFDAMKHGKAIDLTGVIIRGDVILDNLPLTAAPPGLEQTPGVAAGKARVISGAVTIVNSLVHGAVRHQSTQGVLIFNGPVTFSGTTFEQIVDLSRSLFAQSLTLSGAVFLKESYFVQGRFLSHVTCEKTAFGPHTRFHRSVFLGPVTFQQSGFSGVAEFLEVQFEREANLSRTYFKLGTGFSGSRFQRLADFSEAVFDREAFFTFTQFDGDVYFRRATFRSTADFDDAVFKGRDDFSKVLFEQTPQFARVKRPDQSPELLGIENPRIQYAITLSLLIFSALLIVYLIRSR